MTCRRFSAFSLLGVAVVVLTSCSSSGPDNKQASDTTLQTVASGLSRKADLSHLVLTAADVPDGRDELPLATSADLFDETARQFQAALSAAGITPDTGALDRTIHLGQSGDRVDSLVVRASSPPTAEGVFRHWMDLFTFTGLAGGLSTAPIQTPASVGSSAIARMGRDGNGQLSAGVCWLRGRIVSVVIVTTRTSPLRFLNQLAALQDRRVRSLG